ncbi:MULTISPECIES: hypothetical protein [Paraburkholderia]|uniref:Uncharacterized protein n=1 Tax=Paraburkholderia youngii TaxID=2782701 RepID=A0ABX2NWM4_9BURK|nr:hypothetical protein [Paraburkholderia youngii]NVI08901.1 hypothetical protein [Paraburkholderia youngii]
MEYNNDMTLRREAAIALHEQLRATRASVIAIGEFYLSVLELGLWPSLRAIATGLNISYPQVSRMVGAARLPKAVLEVFRNRKLSFRNIQTLQTLTRQLGESELARRTAHVTANCSLEEVFTVLTTGKPVVREGVRVRIIPGKKYLRLDVPNYEQIAPRIVELEAILNALLATYNWKHRAGALSAPKKAATRS